MDDNDAGVARTTRDAGMFSIVIPAYGPAPHLDECLSALADQTSPPAEIIVFHTGPADPTDRIAKRFPEVTVHHEDARQFAGGARNRGAALARAEWLGFLDCDMIADRRWLEMMENEARRFPSGVLFGSVGRRGGGLWGIVMWFIECGSVLPHRRSQDLSSGPGANFAIRSDVFGRTGGFRADLYAAEDGDLFCRFRKAGGTLRLIPAARADHWFEGGSGSLRRLGELGRAAAFLRRSHALPGSAAVRFPALAVLLPFARLAQMTRRLIFERGPFLLFLAVLPFLCAGLVSWSLGFYAEARHPTYPETQAQD